MPKSIPCLMVFFNQRASEQEYQDSKARVLSIAGIKLLDDEDKGRIMAIRKTRTEEEDRALLKEIESVADASASYGSIRNTVLIRRFGKNKK